MTTFRTDAPAAAVATTRICASALLILCAAFMASCSDRGVLQSPAVAPPSYDLVAISDGSNGGNGHFFFLPPVAAQPRFNGTFDRAVLSQLSVVICQLGASCTPVRTFDAGSGLSIPGNSEHFQAQWQVQKDGVDRNRGYRITVKLGAATLGYADVDRPAGTIPIRFRVELGALPPAVADLTVSSVSASPPLVHSGQVISAVAAISNSGTGAAGAATARFTVRAVGTNAELASISVAQPALAPGASASLAASFTAQNTWSAQVVVEVTTDAANVVAESNELNNSKASAPINVAVSPAGYTKTWVGGAAGAQTAWAEATNWAPVGVPTSADNAYIPVATFLPVLSADASITDLLVVPGARIDAGAFTLTSLGNVSAAQINATTGALRMTAPSATFGGNVTKLQLGGHVSESANSTVGFLEVAAGGSLKLNGHTMTVTGDAMFLISNSATDGLIMQHAADLLEVRGSLLIHNTSGATAVDGSLMTAGTIKVAQTFSARATAAPAPTFVSTGTAVVMNGTGAQSLDVSFSSPDAAGGRFKDLTVLSPRVQFGSDITVTGQLTLAPGSRVEQSPGLHTYFTTSLPIVGAGAAYDVVTTHAVAHITMVADALMPVTALIIARNSSVNLNGHTLRVDNLDITLHNGAADGLIMRNAADLLEVRGSLQIDNVFGATAVDGSLLTAGTIKVMQNFSASPSAAPLPLFISTGTAVVFNGTGSQSLTTSFATPDAAGSRFKDLTILSPSLQFGSDVTVTGQLTLAPGSRVEQSPGLHTYFTTSLPIVGAGAAYEVVTTHAVAHVTMVADALMPVTTLMIERNSSVKLNGHTLTVDNLDISLQNGSADGLIMQNAADLLEVRGSLQIDNVFGATAVDGSLMTAGTIKVAQNFRAHASAGPTPTFISTGTAVVFNGTGSQTLDTWFATPDVAGSRFKDLTVLSPSLQFGSDVAVTGQLTLAPGSRVQQSPGLHTYLTTSLPIVGAGAAYDVMTTHAVAHITMVADALMPVTTLMIERNSSVRLNGHTLSVDNLDISLQNGSTDGLIMQNPADVMNAGGTVQIDNVFGATGVDGSLMTAGTMNVRQRFTALSTIAVPTFISTGTAVVFNGAGSQTLELANSSATGNRFAGLKVLQGVSFLTNTYASGSGDLAGSVNVPVATTVTFGGDLVLQNGMVLANSGVVRYAGTLTNNGATIIGAAPVDTAP